MTDMTTSVRNRIVANLLSAMLGGVVSMVTLRMFHDWAFRTEFWYYIRLTAVHSCLMFILFSVWFGIRPEVPRTKGFIKRGAAAVIKYVGAAAIGCLLPVFIPWGFILIVTGQAFITSVVAALVHVGLSGLNNR